jgi:pimeloyl-ACP methyl ester carboxylesterase
VHAWRLTVPSLHLYGAGDNCFSVEMSDGMDDLFTNGFERIVIPGTGHRSPTTSWAS